MAGVSRLSLLWLPFDLAGGPPVDRAMFAVNGVSLLERLERFEGIRPFSYVAVTESDPVARDRLLLKAEPDLPRGRTTLLTSTGGKGNRSSGWGFGNVSAEIEIARGIVTWSRLAVVEDCEDWDAEPRQFQTVRSFRFELEQYDKALHSRRSMC